MKQQYQTRYELLHENYQKWLTGFTRHAVSWGVCHPNIRGLFSDADAYHLDQAFPLLMKQLELMLTSGELNPRHQHTVTLYAKGLTCKADTLSSCGYVYLAVYPTPEMKN